jgi:predicted esterase
MDSTLQVGDGAFNDLESYDELGGLREGLKTSVIAMRARSLWLTAAGMAICGSAVLIGVSRRSTSKGRSTALPPALPTSPPSVEAPAKSDPPKRVRRDSVRVPLSTGNPREDSWQMHESAPLIEPDDEPRSVTLLFHGMCADSSWTCDWLQYFEMAPQWQICPRAPAKCAGEEGFRWTSGAETRRLAELSVATVRERHPGRVRDDAMVLAGFSLGAYTVASLVHELAHTPSTSWHVRGILAQGAHVHFSAADLRALGTRVVLAAGDLDAAAAAMRAEAERLRREGIEVRYASLGKEESHFTSVSTGKVVAQLIDWCRGP